MYRTSTSCRQGAIGGSDDRLSVSSCCRRASAETNPSGQCTTSRRSPTIRKPRTNDREALLRARPMRGGHRALMTRVEADQAALFDRANDAAMLVTVMWNRTWTLLA